MWEKAKLSGKKWRSWLKLWVDDDQLWQMGILLLVAVITLVVSFYGAQVGFTLRAWFPLGLLLVLLAVFKNPSFSFLVTLFVASMVAGAPFYKYLLNAFAGGGFITVLLIGGLIHLMLNSPGGDNLQRMVREWPLFGGKLFVAGALCLINSMSSVTSVNFSAKLLKVDYKGKLISGRQKQQIVKLILGFCVLGCLVFSWSLWWTFFIDNSKGGVTHRWGPALLYALLVGVCLFAADYFAGMKSGRNETKGTASGLREKRPLLIRSSFAISRSCRKTWIFSIVPEVVLPTLVFALTIFAAWNDFGGGLGLSRKNGLLAATVAATTVCMLLLMIRTVCNGYITSHNASLDIESTVAKLDRNARDMANNAGALAGTRCCLERGDLLAQVTGLREAADKLRSLRSESHVALAGKQQKHALWRSPVANWLWLIKESMAVNWKNYLDGAKGMLGTALIFTLAGAFKEVYLNEYINPLSIHLSISSVALTLLVIAAVTTLVGYFLGTAWGTFAVASALFIPVLQSTCSDAVQRAYWVIILCSACINQISPSADNVIALADEFGLEYKDASSEVRGPVLLALLVAVLAVIFCPVLAGL